MHLVNPVRILLQETPLEVLSWTLESSQGFLLYNPHSKDVEQINEPKLIITCSGELFMVQDKLYGHNHLIIMPYKGLISFDSIPYDGFFSLRYTEGQASLVNHIGLEDYLASVLPYESIPSWPDEVQKAICIACRTYTVYKIYSQRNQKNRPHFDLRNTVLDQVYRGHAKKSSIKRIVDSTKDMIITHEGDPILAMYSSICGSIIPANINSPILINAPYLKRSYACTHCKSSPLYRWTTNHSLKELEKPLHKIHPKLGELKEVRITSYDQAGIAQKVLLTGSQKQVTMAAHDFRMIFYKTIKSNACEIIPNPQTFKIKGKGWGHHIGLCQWGAHAMDIQGHTYDQILSFYYPGSVLCKLKKEHFFKS
jgi:stage II sporulation protein D